MKSIFVFFLALSVALASAQNKAAPHKKTGKPHAKKIRVSGVVTQTRSYCGGARPPDEVFQMLATPKPFPGKKFYVIKGQTNSDSRKIIRSFTSDTAGRFSFVLPSGTYAIILEEQAKPLNTDDYKGEYISVDSTCLAEWWTKPYYLLKVRKTAVKDLKFNFHHRCFLSNDNPCLGYTGPSPE